MWVFSIKKKNSFFPKIVLITDFIVILYYPNNTISIKGPTT